jgi:hypothetical protein
MAGALVKEGRMAKRATLSASEEQIELLRRILIVQLALAGVPQNTVRAIVGGDIKRINEVMKHLPKKRQIDG